MDANMDFLNEAARKLSATPHQIDELVRGLTEEQLSWKPTADIFSVRENVMHLRDIDVEGYAKRTQLILDEERPTLPDLNGKKLARERNYNAQPVQRGLHDLRASRVLRVAVLQKCSPSDLERKAQWKE